MNHTEKHRTHSRRLCGFRSHSQSSWLPWGMPKPLKGSVCPELEFPLWRKSTQVVMGLTISPISADSTCVCGGGGSRRQKLPVTPANKRGHKRVPMSAFWRSTQDRNITQPVWWAGFSRHSSRGKTLACRPSLYTLLSPIKEFCCGFLSGSTTISQA